MRVAVVQPAEPDAGQQKEPRDRTAGQQLPAAAAAPQPAGAHQHRFQSEKGNILSVGRRARSRDV